MPVSANEEIGVKPITRQPCDYLAGIPIKKRRFPLIRPPSPPAEEPSPKTVESPSLQKDQSSPSQGSTLSYSSAGTSSSSLSDAIKNPEPEERRGSSSVANDYAVQGNNNFMKLITEEPSLAVQPRSLDSMNNKEKAVMGTNLGNQMIAGKNELNLAPPGSLALNLGANRPIIKQRTEVKVEAVASALQENTKSLLKLNDHFVPALSSQNTERSDQNQKTLEPISLNLSLSKERSNSQVKGDVKESNVDSAHPHANRANWDLNIPMDTWEGSSSDVVPSQTLVDGMVTAGQAQDSKPLIGVAVASKKHSSKDSDNLTNFPISSKQSSHQCKSDDSLHLRLSPSCLHFNVQEASTTTPKLDSNKVIPNANLPRAVVSGSNLNIPNANLPRVVVSGSSLNIPNANLPRMVVPSSNLNIPNANLPRMVVPCSYLNKVNIRPVKSEPVDESIKLDRRGPKLCNMGLLDAAAVKRESGDQGCLEAVNSPHIYIQKSVDSRSIKSEPTLEGNKETINSLEGTSVHLNEHTVQGPDKHFPAAAKCKFAESACPEGNSSLLTEHNHSSAAVMCTTAEIAQAEYEHSAAVATCKTAEIACPVVSSSFSTELLGGDLSNHSGKVNCTSAGYLEVQQEARERSRQVEPDTCAMPTNVDGEVDTARAEDSNIDNQKLCGSKSVHSRGGGEGTASDEERINISAEIEDSYSSDIESDGNHAIDMAIDMELDSDYEDGEVREPLERTAVEEPVCEKGQSGCIDNSNFNKKEMDTVRLVNDADPRASDVEGKDLKTDIAETDKKDGEVASDAVHSNNCDEGFDKTVCLQEPSFVENPTDGSVMNETTKTELRLPLDQLVNRHEHGHVCPETNSEQATSRDEETLPTNVQGTDLSVNHDDLVPRSDTALVKSASNSDNGAKDSDSGINRSRIINLPRSSDSSPPGRTRTFSGRLFQSRGGRERVSDVVHEGEKIHSRGREEIYIDGAQKFSRERHHDQTPRNSRFNFMRGRGRITNRLDSFRGDRESDRDFTSEFYNSPTEFRVPRHKYASSVSDADHEYNTYNITQDGAYVGSGHGGRKPINDEGPFGRRMPSRRRSPGAARGNYMGRRISRNISPSRCVGEGGSELDRLRRNEKFVRGFPDDTIGPMFARSQPPFEGVDGHFAQGNRNFPSVQRRVMHSKSPLSSRTRSPPPWSSPRRRSPDGFAGHPDLPHQRSPPFFRMERRSPDRRCFPGEVVRRHDMREMDSGRDHGHPGSGMPNRSPSSRIVVRDRRFSGLDPPERPEGENFFGAPIHSSRLHELGGDVNGGEDRRFGERRGPVRAYRTPFNGAEGESFHLNSEDGSRPLRFCSEDDAEFQERGNLMEREFHRRMTNRPGNAPRRMRNIDEQEANYRHGGQVWHNNDFEEISRVKRKRF